MNPIVENPRWPTTSRIAGAEGAEAARHFQDIRRPITFHGPVATALECSKITALPHPSNWRRFFNAPKVASLSHAHEKRNQYLIFGLGERVPSEVII